MKDKSTREKKMMESRSSDLWALEVSTWFNGYYSSEVVRATLLYYSHCNSGMKVWLPVFTLTF